MIKIYCDGCGGELRNSSREYAVNMPRVAKDSATGKLKLELNSDPPPYPTGNCFPQEPREVWCEGCLADAVRRLDKRPKTEGVSEKELREFQDKVRNVVIQLSGAPDSAIDGKGSDAGWEEFTLAEISQGFAYLKEQQERLYAQRIPRIYTRCPACKNDTLTISSKGRLLCTWHECPNPVAIERMCEPQTL